MNILSYPSPKEVAQKLAERIAEEVEKKPVYHLAITGGEDAPMVYQALAAANINWQKVRLYFVSEVISGRQAGINYDVARHHLITKVPIREEQVYRIPIDADSAAQAAQSYQQQVTGEVPLLNGYPLFDAVLLALHEDGHVAEIHPGQEELYYKEDVYLVNKRPESGEETVTLSFQALSEVKKIFLYAFGDDIRFVIGNMVNLMPEAKAYPANVLTALNPWSTLYADAAAMREKSYAIY